MLALRWAFVIMLMCLGVNDDAVNGDDPGVGPVGAEEGFATHKRAGGACTDEKIVDPVEIFGDGARRGIVVGSGIGEVGIIG